MTVSLKPIPHVQMEPGSSTCGAACLKMLFDYYGIQDSIDSIWDGISRYDSSLDRRNCNTFLMAKYCFEKHALFSVFVSTTDPFWLIRVCLKRNIDIVPLYRPDLSNGYAHFSVVVGIDDHFVYLNDPEIPAPAGVGCAVSLDTFRHMLLPIPYSEIHTPNTFLLVAKGADCLIPCKCNVLGSSNEYCIFDMPSFLVGKDLVFAHPPHNSLFNSISRK